MYDLKTAKKHKQAMEQIHGNRWEVFKVPSGAAINKKPLNLYNKGEYAICRAEEREDYEAGGAVFVS